MSAATETIRITVQEKGRPDHFTADVEPDCTGAEIVSGLVEEGYLAPESGDRAYKLVLGRTGAAINSGSTLKDSEVTDGDVLTVTSNSTGA